MLATLDREHGQETLFVDTITSIVWNVTSKTNIFFVIFQSFNNIKKIISSQTKGKQMGASSSPVVTSMTHFLPNNVKGRTGDEWLSSIFKSALHMTLAPCQYSIVFICSFFFFQIFRVPIKDHLAPKRNRFC